jgi:hypothetical protein
MELHVLERALMMRSLTLKFEMVLIVRNLISGLFEEHR